MKRKLQTNTQNEEWLNERTRNFTTLLTNQILISFCYVVCVFEKGKSQKIHFNFFRKVSFSHKINFTSFL